MGYGIETVCGYYTATATTGAQAYTAASTQSFNVRATAPNTVATLETVWTSSADAGYTRIRSPRLHDDVVGIEFQHYVTNTSPVANEYFSQTLYSQDSLIVEDYFTTAPGTNKQTVGFNVYYNDLPGVAGNYMSWAQVQSRIQSYMGVYVLPQSAATFGNYGTGVALNSSQDFFKANSLYALVGYNTPNNFTAFTILGPDLGNLQVGGPGCTDPLVTNRWFAFQDHATGMPSIPVINSQNKSSTLVQIFDTSVSTTKPLQLLFAYLGPIS
jgi:hypothetical protein